MVELRQECRVEVTLHRIASVPELRARLEPLLLAGRDAIAASAGPMVLCHGDSSRGNLVLVGGERVWVDFEYSGMGPASLDVGVGIAHALRFFGREAAREFVAGYRDAGGEFEVADAMVLAGLRELYGIADYSWQQDEAHRRLLEIRLASLGELSRQTRWETLG